VAGFSHGRKKGKNKMKHLPRKDTEFHGRKNKNNISHKFDNQKSANGAVAVGLPHRNRSVFKQAHINKRQVKGNDPSSAVDGLEDDVGG
jgi:hypothetical protein